MAPSGGGRRRHPRSQYSTICDGRYSQGGFILMAAIERWQTIRRIVQAFSPVKGKPLPCSGSLRLLWSKPKKHSAPSVDIKYLFAIT
jgi:hypothetical protein